MSVLFLWKIYFHPLGDRTAAQVNWVTSDGLLKYFRPLSPGFLRSSLLNIDCFLKIQKITFKLTLALQIQKKCTPKVSFFWDPSQDKNLCCFLIGSPSLPKKSLAFGGKLISWLRISEKTVFRNIYILTTKLTVNSVYN